MSVFIMLNNFIHDFVVALLFSILLVMNWIYLQSKKKNFQVRKEFAKDMFHTLNKSTIWIWALIIVGGIIRTINYKEFEWSEAAGKDQIPALIVKHILLVILVIFGTTLQLRLRKIFKKEN